MVVITSRNAVIFWGEETGFGSGLAGEHKCFSPVENFTLPRVKKVVKTATTMEQWVPSVGIEVQHEEGEVTYTAIYRDPFMMSYIFDYVAIAGTWVTDDGIIELGMDSEEFANTPALIAEPTIWIRADYIDSGAVEIIQRIFSGGLITRWKITAVVGDFIKEEVTVRVSHPSVEETTAMNATAGFHGGEWNELTTVTAGGWAGWNDNSPYNSTAMAFTFAATLIDKDNFKINEISLEISRPVEFVKVSDDLAAVDWWKSGIDYTVTIKGFIQDPDLVEEIEAAYASRTKDDAILTLTDSDAKTQVWHLSDMYIAELSGHDELGGAGVAQEVTVTLKPVPATGNNRCTCWYTGTFDKLADPTDHVAN